MRHIINQKLLLFFPLISLLIPAVNPRGDDIRGEKPIGVDIRADNHILTDEEILKAGTEAVEWLKEMIVPNDTVPSPDLTRRRLILSYRIPKEDPVYPYLFSRSFVYDDALGIIALTMAGEYREAENILEALRRLMREDGSFWFTYNTHNYWPNEDDHEGAILRTGAVAWVGYAAAFYLNTRIKEDKEFLKKDRLAAGFLKMAESIGSFMLGHQVLDTSDRRHGLVTGGWATYNLKLPNETGGPIELYSQSDITWVSTEHNIDIYFFLRDLGRLTGKSEYIKAAGLVKKGLLNLWSEDKMQFFRGMKGDQRMDTALPLDGASWASIFLISIGEDEKAGRCIAAIEDRFASRSGGIKGYGPYSSEHVYEEESVNKFYYPGDPDKIWDDINMIWVEGSLGVAAAYIKEGNSRKALEIIESMMLLRSGRGFRYANINIPYQFNDNPGVASTAWFVIAVRIMTDRDVNNLFWGK